jgi:hypothetical protein
MLIVEQDAILTPVPPASRDLEPSTMQRMEGMGDLDRYDRVSVSTTSSW